ncbi:unnamed protein product [Paramecium pentaurelia]|uniref:Uncharacterized protein n=1 Tax=Paramecium pentaurelia TaxID=43138 RepID=A0A8S1Y088_9CILI|nr:unnamed protein product [Paramecium pentaurelia]
MQIKYLLLIAILLTITKQVTVTKTDECDECTQFKSSSDCKSSKLGCTWTEKTVTTPGSCGKTTAPPPVTYTPYCSTIETANCAKTFGCALIEGKCTHFTGCSAYVKTTHSDCQNISNLCITNGTTCTNALECIGYTKEQCETTPSLKSPYKCKLEGETCREYNCTEADSSLATHGACDTWKAGCKTTGAGCIDSIPSCNNYQGTSETCPKMRGSDGNCEFNPEGNNCRPRVCTGADTSLNSDEDCGKYQDKCLTTGKGCIAIKPSCSNYTGNAITCIGYIGTDGDCAGDATGTKCRARLCSEKTATTDDDCGKWKTGCQTNGRQCVDSLGNCNTYEGTITTCAQIKGLDGNCKGTSTTTAKCVLKDCVTDSNETFKTKDQCLAVQLFCKTTGKGCVATLSNCSSYSFTDDGTSCNSLYGLNGRCKAGTGGKCADRVCTEAPTSYTSQPQCEEYKSGCVPTGAGCVSPTLCQDTVKQVTCEGTDNCGWNSICVSKTSCGLLTQSKSVCESVKINERSCKWESNTCRPAKCDDFTATDDNTCNTLLPGCVTNGTKCVDGSNCAAQFKGTQSTCQGYKAKCTNDTNATETTACKPKTCDDSYLEYISDTDCSNYLAGCVTKGKGCIIDTAQCSSYTGTPEQCDKFKGNKTIRCWNTSATSGSCTNKQCNQATGMADNNTCEDFLTGCLYDGNGSCVDKSAQCTAYTGDATTCPGFTGGNGSKPCYKGASGKCRDKSCYDDTTSDSDGACDTFLPGCVTKGTGCIPKTSLCSAYQGTTDKCLTFTGNSAADKCTRLEPCISKSNTCNLKTEVTSNTDCLTYHADCRFKLGDNACRESVGTCAEYTFTSTDDTERQNYCNTITTKTGSLCSYNPTVTGKCSARACNLWVSALANITCENYNGTSSCKSNGASYCYAPQNSCELYTIPNSITEAAAKLTWCNGMFTDAVTPTKCSYDSATSTTCSDIDTCEEIISPTSAADCNKKLDDGECQFTNNKCITTKAACTGYSLTGITTGQAAYCSALKSDDSTTVKQCAYNSATTTTCVEATATTILSIPTNPTYTDPSAITFAACNTITSPTSQADCNVGTGSCKYYKSACYARVACASYTIPGSITAADDKQYFCQNMFEDTADTYCSYDSTANSNNGGCVAGKTACTEYTLTGTDNTAKALACSKLRIKTGSACAHVADATTCSAPADNAAKCTVVAAGITTDADCDLRTILGCKKHATADTCIARDACTAAVSGTTNDEKATNCQANPGPDSIYCSYEASGVNCVVAKSACTGYVSVPVGTELTYCQTRVNQIGKRCSWTSGSTCADAQATCAGYSSLSGTGLLALCQAKIDQVGVKCSWNIGATACIAAPKTCAGWSTLPTSGQLEFCQARIKSDGKSCSWTTGAACSDAPATCAGWSTLPASGQLEFCLTKINQNGQRCSWTTSASACSDAPAACSGWNSVPTSGQLEYCQAKYKQDGKKCSWINGTSCSDAQTLCTSLTNLPSSEELAYCQQRIKQNGLRCSWTTGTSACSDAPVACSGWSTLPQSGQLEFCLTKINQNGFKCAWNTSGTTCIDLPAACTGWNSLPTSGQLEFCLARSNLAGQKCSWVTAAAACSDAPSACSNWNSLPSSGQLAFCQAKFRLDGGKCSWTTGASCRDYSCEDTLSPQSQADCDVIGTGCTYQPQNQICYIKQSACTSYTPTGLTDDDKLNYCNNLVNTSNAGCTFLKKGSVTTCSVLAACTGYNVSSITDAGNTCVAVGACTSYTGASSADNIVADCAKQKDAAGFLCFGTGTACVAATCNDVTGATSIDDCKKYANNCVYSTQKCYTQSATCNYSTGGTNAISLCNSLKDTNGNFCTADADSDATCKQRTCNDTATKMFQTHEECKAYLPTCKSNGNGCILETTTCAQQSGYLNYCDWVLDTNNKSTCAKGTSATTDASCTNLSCDLNVTATNDSECQSFHPDCLNNGLGCIHKNEACSSYYGTKEQCQQFIGNGKKCFGDSTSGKKACRERKCTDMTTATGNSDCENFLPGCLYNGAGCVPKSDPCSAYKGTQTICSGFKGSNGTKYCWGASDTASGNCADRKCSDKQGTTDAECQTFLPPISTSSQQLCITDGTKCTDIGKQCSFFKGTDETCQKFTATDGPCKASAVSATPVACTPKVCYEAPNTFTTDKQCQDYHPSCKTTGRGCKSNVGCGDYTSLTSCTTNTSCQWAGQCRSEPATCSSLTSLGQTICVNTPLTNGKKCAWFNGATSQTSVCRDFTCADYDGSITTHKDCQDKDLTCTTSGAGCVTLGTCSSYKSQTVCEAANTTEDSLRCFWNSATAACRQRQCADGVFTTDDACKTWLTGCKTSGITCIGPTFGCGAFDGNPKLCQQNSAGNPCYYVDGTCYDYDNCTDITSQTFSVCQKFSKQCVPTNSTCRAITLCDKYEDVFSCTIGINDTKCGWLPEGKCKDYTACSDANGANLSACASWGSTCVSDGIKCVDKGTCSSYLTPSACDNDGTDGKCQWTGTSCRLRECTDNAATTDSECLAYVVKSGLCTTDGAKCVPRSTCGSYQSETACTTGQDGVPCIFDLPVGATTGTKSCRPKECTDIKGVTNDACIGQIPNKACVSNGINCVKQDTCANYKNKLSCKAGGSDGKCAFTPAPTVADPNNGTCQSFKSCETGNNDKDACDSKSKACKWSSTTSGTTTTTKCQPMDCAGVASGTTCNPFQSFDGASSTICVLVNNQCTVGDPSTLTVDQCYKTQTLYSYTWNESTNKCVSCKASTNNNNNTTNPNTTDPDTNTDDNGYILGVTIPLAILGIFV